MKTVKFQGKEYHVDDWVNYITIDAFGKIEGWKKEPWTSGNEWCRDDLSKENWVIIINDGVDMFKLKV